MKFLFIHQNFPGQYRELVAWLAAQDAHEIVFLTQRDVRSMRGIKIVRYAPPERKSDTESYALSRHWEDSIRTGFGAAMACESLKEQGFTPDIILGHMGWGEVTFTKIIWPDTPVIGLFEYYYLSSGGSVDFDPEFPANPQTPYFMHARNALNHLNLETVDLGQVPTRWQKNTFPKSFHKKFYTCHDGIRTDILCANPDATIKLQRLDREVSREDEIFTYMARNMEPVRGFHIFMRALPKILEQRPNARALIVGGNGASYGFQSREVGGWRGKMQREVGEHIDWSRVHFLGRVPYKDFQRVIQISRCHIYLTVPFVPSWSLLEAMSMQATIVASDVAPVREVITHEKNGLLVDFIDPDALAQQVCSVLAAPKDFAKLGSAARKHIIKNYDFQTRTLPVHLQKINKLVPTALRHSRIPSKVCDTP